MEPFSNSNVQRGHRVDGAWVLGAIEHLVDPTTGKGRAGRFFALVVENRDRETIFPIVKKYIRPGSVIHTDGWGAYKALGKIEGYNYSHDFVEHTHEFKNKKGTHTNTIEGAWQAKFKRVIPNQHYNKYALPGQLMKQIWNDQHKNHLWNDFWKLLSRMGHREKRGLL